MDRHTTVRPPADTLDLDRRTFLQVLGSGLLITVTAPEAWAQPGESSGMPVSARLFLNEDGTITALSGKVEEGQGPRAELSQAAAEELRVSVDRVRLVMADTDLVPDDGITAGSRTTPRNVPEMRQAAATARELLTKLAAREWNVEAPSLAVRDGVITGPTGQTMTYADLAKAGEVAATLDQAIRTDVALTSVNEWKVLGQSAPRPNVRDLVNGAHRFPSDVVRPGMLYGRVLRPPAYGATLESVDFEAAKALDDVVVVREEGFVGFAAPSSHRATRALETVAGAASWKTPLQPVSHETVFEHLRKNARSAQARTEEKGATQKALEAADRVLEGSYRVAYIQHAPMEPRAAVAEWSEDGLTVWAGCDGPFRSSSPTWEGGSVGSTPPRPPSRRPVFLGPPSDPCPCSGRARRSSPGRTADRPR
jgi:isoquinoline 1-oxidoreductase